MKERRTMVKIDIVGEFNESIDEILDKGALEISLINQITEPEDFQEILIVYPPPKGKFRWKEYSREEADILYKYVENGGILVLIPPFNSLYLEKTSAIYEKFQTSPVFCQENLLTHFNAHMINHGKEGKRPVKNYIHFLTPEKGTLEVIIEGNWIPIFAFKFIGKGAVVLYGLGSAAFWKEDLQSVFKYLQNDYEFFWDKTELGERELENILKCSRKEIHDKVREEFIRAFARKKRFNQFLEIKNASLREDLLKNIQDSTIEEEFKDFSGKLIEKKYRELYNSLIKEYPDLIKKIQKFLFKKVMDKTINEKVFNKLYESDLLPPKAAHLVIFYLNPEDPEQYKKYKENLMKLIQWNKEESIFDEDFLKELAWKHL
jgi:hypothetical protein